MERYICIHGHFYQPPRENPWLEAVEQQDSAYPYHDWNQRITAECYDPNSASRILDGEHRIVDIVNNYSRISFNFGPTLLSWLEAYAPAVYAAILEADRESRQRFSGHGSALAQAYNHAILPLADRRDKRTQVAWGIRDFEHRFGRRPEGMWLPETAVDTETLEALAEQGVRFTVLAPSQARRVRPLGGRAWRDVSGGRIDPSQAYEAKLPSGHGIALFFYDGPISRAVAFEGLLHNGEQFAGRLAGGFSDARSWPQLVHVATDGETYGHHHRWGDSALAYALNHIESTGMARLTNYGEYLERHPPAQQVEIVEGTAWSCAHGVGRWWTDCGCNSGGRPGWNQAWRTPLRNTLDWLRDQLAPRFEAEAGRLVRDPWAARDAYIDVILDRAPASRRRFLDAHAAGGLAHEQVVRLWKLLELQRHAQLMYTSCGWFFDDVSGIETVQILHYAGAALQIAQELFGASLEGEFRNRLAEARSNVPEQGDGARIFDRAVKPATVDLGKVAAHYGISSLFEDYEERTRIYSYTVERQAERRLQAGRSRMLVGRARLTSEITEERAELTYGVLHLGDHNLSGGVRPFRSLEEHEELAREAEDAIGRADLPEAIRTMDRHFGAGYPLKSLFRDEQRKIVRLLLEATLAEATAVFSQVYDRNVPLMRFVAELGTPLPKVLLTSAEFVLNSRLRELFKSDEPDLEQARALLEAARRDGVGLDGAGLGYALERTVERLAERLHAHPEDVWLLQNLEALCEFVHSLPFEVKLWKVQNLFFALLRGVYPEVRARNDEESKTWVDSFLATGERLGIRMPKGEYEEAAS